MVDFSRISGRNLRNFIDFSMIPGYPVMKNGNSMVLRHTDDVNCSHFHLQMLKKHKRSKCVDL